MPDALQPGSLDLLASTPGTLRALLAGLDEAVVGAPGPEGWSPRDVLAHVLSVQQPGFTARVRFMVEQDEPPVPNVDEDAVLETSGLRSRPMAELLDGFSAARAATLALLSTLDEMQFARGGNHEIAGRITVAEIVHHHVFHDLSHVRQICALLEGPAEAARGAMRGGNPSDLAGA